MGQKIANECLVCSTAFSGPAGVLFHLFGIQRSTRNPNICNRCNAHMQEGKIIELSVLFADLTGFTAMTNRLGAERSYQVIDAFFTMANEELIKNDAFIDKYIGDAVMAIFNAPIPNVKHARGATLAALGIQHRLEAVAEKVGVELQARVGVSTGYARVGQVGSADRKDYTAIGDVVNLSSRLEAIARPGEVVVDAKAFAQIAEEYPTLTPEIINVRGFAEPVEIYRIGKTHSNNTQAILQPQDPLTARRRISLGTILFTIFGVPCAVATTLSPLAIALGIGSLMGAIGPFFHFLDAMQIRVPLQIFAVLGATINLYVIQKSKAQQKLLDAPPLTRLEKRKVKLMTSLSLISLAAVAYEIYVHIFVLGMPYLSPSL